MSWHCTNWGAKRIAHELGVACNTVRRDLRGAPAEVQEPPAGRRLTKAARAEALRLFDAEAESNAVVVVTPLLRDVGVEASVRTVQRAVEVRRRSQRASQVATVRFEKRRASKCRSTLASAWCASPAR